eukprot:CAMPEP_0178919972 /NCGR_PEP_ID=MMETSP0786-20121207/14740_1 /TAXON_ID=186022 /ORGANISM="Thalassionema frauenfeldii, Strain CCMP 1798" /LENGTH=74 /DNA_ID=CAMNT_0020593975 /DNA_START=127 /DNA_END=351 /DNA_ORIENTATION=+
MSEQENQEIAFSEEQLPSKVENEPETMVDAEAQDSAYENVGRNEWHDKKILLCLTTTFFMSILVFGLIVGFGMN